jgi:hypothetical protein
MIRQLTDEEKSRLLTQQEVNELDEGTRVMVKWSGGNGPHEYEIRQGSNGPHIDGTPLDYVGTERPRTRVFLPDGES